MPRLQRTYVICTTARSGSNLVCDYLAKTERLGRPTEFFNPDIVRKGAFGQRFSFSDHVAVADYLAWLKETHSTPNGIFGLKMLFEDYEHLGRFPAIRALLGQAVLVRLTRRRKIAQAISYLMAVETGQWMASDPSLKAPEAVEYDVPRIDRYLDMLARQDAHWDIAVDCLARTAMYWSFESFASDPSSHISDLATQLEVDLDGAPITTALAPQSTETSRTFLARYRTDHAESQRAEASITYEHLAFEC